MYSLDLALREEMLSHKDFDNGNDYNKTFSYHKTRIFHFISKNLRPGILKSIAK